jgi:hypothetical protein
MPYVDKAKKYAHNKVWRKVHPEGNRARANKYRKDHLMESAQARVRKQARYKAILTIYKLTVGCQDCGYKVHAEALDLDHRPEEAKLFALSRGWAYSWDKVIAEAEKCDVVCANCHRVRTADRRQSASH